MAASDKSSLPRTPGSSSTTLTILTAIVYFIGFAMVSAWFALLVLGQPAQAPRSANFCTVCGVVQRVVESERASLQIMGEQSEGFVVLLAALGGGLKGGTPARRVYETAVLHDDGSVRIVRDSSEPQWKRGDRVRVIKGRIEQGAPPSADAAKDSTSAVVPAVSQEERMPSPALPVAQAQ